MQNDRLFLTSSTSFRDLVAALDMAGTGFIAIVDSREMLVGVVTDGDIRRAILNNKGDVKDIINTNPISMPVDSDIGSVKRKLRSIHRRHMPLVSEQGVLIRVVVLENSESVAKENYVVVMAGGLGSRLGELTKNIPKPMLPVGGRPILELIVKSFSDFGYANFIFCVNYRKEIIKDYFGDGASFGVSITYIEEEEKLGTAGALSLIDQRLDAPFFVINGDVLTSLEYDKVLEFHNEMDAVATMCFREFEHQIPYGVINTNQKGVIASLDEKPVYSFRVNAGAYILNPVALEHMTRGEHLDMPTLFERLIASQYRACCFPLDGYWKDIGVKSDYETANKDMSGDDLSLSTTK